MDTIQEPDREVRFLEDLAETGLAIRSDIALPDLPSDLIQLAIDDANSLDRNRYVANSAWWHSTNIHSQTCNICFAGAVIAGTLKGRPTHSIHPAHFHCTVEGRDANETSDKLSALDDFRKGNFSRGVGELPIQTTPSQRDSLNHRMSIPTHYNFSNWAEYDIFLTEMALAVTQLKQIGL